MKEFLSYANPNRPYEFRYNAVIKLLYFLQKLGVGNDAMWDRVGPNLRPSNYDI
jgi:hypothetical protein